MRRRGTEICRRTGIARPSHGCGGTPGTCPSKTRHLTLPPLDTASGAPISGVLPAHALNAIDLLPLHE